MSAPAADITEDAIVSVRDLQVQFQTSDRRATVKAVDGVNFDVRRGETFGIIGESGSGKTTIGRALVFLLKPSAGAILHNGVDPLELPRKQFQLLELLARRKNHMTPKRMIEETLYGFDDDVQPNPCLRQLS